MLSCDTLAIKAKSTVCGQNILAKNSDRPTAEAQPLRYFPARQNAAGRMLQMTHLSIEDAPKTYATIGSQPYWIWGFEMGFNECGLVIGNEAEGSKNAAESETGILGMDLLRLGLERAATAREAITIITSLLEQYGQNACASQLMDRRYENAFLLADRNEIWLLETAGRKWVAKQIEDRLGISNAYTIEKDFDLCVEGLEELAREKKWLAPDEPFDFAKAYTMPSIRQTLAVPRKRRLNKLLDAKEFHDTESLKQILRDHFEGEITDTRFGAANGVFMSICMHAREWGESETEASLISRIDPTLGVVSRFALAQPCHSVYLPVYFTGYLPAKLSAAEGVFSEDSLWWKLKRLSLAASADERFAPEMQEKMAALESDIDATANDAEREASALIADGKKDEAFALLNGVMDKACALVEALCDAEYARIANELKARGGLYGPNAQKIEKYCDYAKIPFLT